MLHARPRSLVLLAVVVLLTALALPTGVAASDLATAVSPGASERASEIGSSCPSFSWSAVSGASGYELAVLDLAVPGEPAVVLRHRVDGLALSWTPGLAECLQPGGSFAWTVRALDAAGRGMGSETGWSAPKRFSIRAIPTVDEVAAAIDLLRRWQSQPTGDSGSAPLPSPSPAERGLSSRVAEASGTSAIRGENPATTGANYGVWGQASSTSGAGLVGVNTTSGPDLVLDGVANGEADTLLTQAGIDRPSLLAQTFTIQNSGGGPMRLYVGASQVSLSGHVHAGTDITSGLVADARIAATIARDSEIVPAVLAGDGAGSTLDADLLDGLQGQNYQRRVTGVCAEGETLQGINADGTVACVEAPRPPEISTVESTIGEGKYLSLAVGVDAFGLSASGTPIISYWGQAGADLKVAICNDTHCRGGDELILTIDSAANVGQYTSIAVGAGGSAAVAYRDATNSSLKVATCDASCGLPASWITSTVDNSADVGSFTSIAIDASNLPVISYYDDTNSDLKLAKCNDEACSGGDETRVTVDASAGDVGQYSALALGSDGFPVIAYHDHTNRSLKVAKCSNATCTTRTLSTLNDPSADVGYNAAIAIGTDNLPVVSYYDAAGQVLKVAKCNDTACSGANETISIVDTYPAAGGSSTSIAIGADGNPVIAAGSFLPRIVRVVKCNDPACSGGDELAVTLDDSADVGVYVDLAIGTDTYPIVGYYDTMAGLLKVAKCRNTSCLN